MISVPSSYIYAHHGGRGVQNACCGAPCRRNCPIRRFSTGVTISIFYNKELRVWQKFAGLWLITVSYSIGIMDAVRLWEAADPKDKICFGISPPYLTGTLIACSTIPLFHSTFPRSFESRLSTLTHALMVTACVWSYRFIENSAVNGKMPCSWSSALDKHSVVLKYWPLHTFTN